MAYYQYRYYIEKDKFKKAFQKNFSSNYAFAQCVGCSESHVRKMMSTGDVSQKYIDAVCKFLRIDKNDFEKRPIGQKAKAEAKAEENNDKDAIKLDDIIVRINSIESKIDYLTRFLFMIGNAVTDCAAMSDRLCMEWLDEEKYINLANRLSHNKSAWEKEKNEWEKSYGGKKND